VSFSDDTKAASDFVRFMRHVKIGAEVGDCWEWMGNRPDGRHGHFSIGTDKTVKAHRWIYERIVSAIPESLMLRHKCDFDGCVNPMHLEPGTGKDNTQDCITRGRWSDRKGAKHPLALLTENQVKAIRNSYACGIPQSKIAGTYGISRSQVGKIVRRENWGHV
jgi:hypothetical protein